MKKLGFGLMRLPLSEPEVYKSVDIEAVKPMIDLFIEKGFTYFDTAYIYNEGQSEVAARETLVKRYPRDRFLLATKMPVMILENAEQQEQIFKEQLQNCGVDFFDYYLLHGLNQTSYSIDVSLEFFRNAAS